MYDHEVTVAYTCIIDLRFDGFVCGEIPHSRNMSRAVEGVFRIWVSR